MTDQNHEPELERLRRLPTTEPKGPSREEIQLACDQLSRELSSAEFAAALKHCDELLHVHTASSDTGLKCHACRGQIRKGHEFTAEPWPSRGGFSYQHVTCPPPARSANPELRVIQGANPRRRT